MRKTILACCLILFFALSAHADSVFSGTAEISVVTTGSTETTDWNFNFGSADSFSVTHTFTNFTVFPWGGWQFNPGGTNSVALTGDFPAAMGGWLGELEGFSDTPVPFPLGWNVILFPGSAGDQCKFCANWSPIATPEPPTGILLGFSGLLASFFARFRKATSPDETQKNETIRALAERDLQWQATLRNAQTNELLFLKKTGALIPERYLRPWSRSRFLPPFTLSELNPPFVPPPKNLRLLVSQGVLSLESGAL